MTRTLYGIKACDTMKKARVWLDQNGVAYDFHDYKAAGADRADVERWVAEHGWEKVLNRAGTPAPTRTPPSPFSTPPRRWT